MGELTPQEMRELERETWQYRSLAFLRQEPGAELSPGFTRRKMAYVLMAIMGRVPNSPPYFGMVCRIDAAGQVHTDFVDDRREVWPNAYLCTAIQLRDAVLRTIEGAGLEEDAALKLMDETRKWIEIDMRAINNVEGDDNGPRWI